MLFVKKNVFMEGVWFFFPFSVGTKIRVFSLRSMKKKQLGQKKCFFSVISRHLISRFQLPTTTVMHDNVHVPLWFGEMLQNALMMDSSIIFRLHKNITQNTPCSPTVCEECPDLE